MNDATTFLDVPYPSDEMATIRKDLLVLAVMGSNMPPDKAVKLASQYYDWVYADKGIDG